MAQLAAFLLIYINDATHAFWCLCALLNGERHSMHGINLFLLQNAFIQKSNKIVHTRMYFRQRLPQAKATAESSPGYVAAQAAETIVEALQVSYLLFQHL